MATSWPRRCANVSRIGKPCEHPLGFTPDPNAKIAVLVDGQSVATGADTWSFDASASTVMLTGALCAKAQASSVAAPMQLEIRVLELVQ